MTAADIEQLRPAAKKCCDHADELGKRITRFAARLEEAIDVQEEGGKTLRAFALEAGTIGHEVQGLRMAIVNIINELEKVQPIPGAPLKVGRA